MTILRGEFFGEMALFSGEPSPLSIAAFDDLQPTFRRCRSDFFISCENLEAKRF